MEAQFQRDEELYLRLVAEIAIYNYQFQRGLDWQATVLFSTRSIEPSAGKEEYREFFASGRIRVIFLDKLPDTSSPGMEAIRLIVTSKKQAASKAKGLFEQIQQSPLTDEDREKLADLITSIMVYKLPNIGREEVEAMIGIEFLRDTKVYQEAHEEGRDEGREEGREDILTRAIPKMVEMGLAIEKIADTLGVTPEEVRKIASAGEGR